MTQDEVLGAIAPRGAARAGGRAAQDDRAHPAVASACTTVSVEGDPVIGRRRGGLVRGAHRVRRAVRGQHLHHQRLPAPVGDRGEGEPGRRDRPELGPVAAADGRQDPRAGCGRIDPGGDLGGHGARGDAAPGRTASATWAMSCPSRPSSCWRSSTSSSATSRTARSSRPSGRSRRATARPSSTRASSGSSRSIPLISWRVFLTDLESLPVAGAGALPADRARGDAARSWALARDPPWHLVVGVAGQPRAVRSIAAWRWAAGRIFRATCCSTASRPSIGDIVGGAANAALRRGDSARARAGGGEPSGGRLPLVDGRRAPTSLSLNQRALSSVYFAHSAGTESSGKIALTGHSGSQAPQSMHSSGSMTACGRCPGRSGCSRRGRPRRTTGPGRRCTARR